MATNYQQDGKTLDFQNTGEADILSGDAVVVGALVGVAHDNIPVGLWGLLHTDGVFVLPKAPGVIATGEKLYLAAGNLTTQAAGADDETVTYPLAGTAWGPAEDADAAVAVRLGY